MDTGNTSTGHLAWCGLVALQLAKQDGTVITPAQESLFLTRWLAVAEKQRRFRKELASDIRWLLKEGREKGVRADLTGKLEYLWRSGSADLLAQNDLYRLQHALQQTKPLPTRITGDLSALDSLLGRSGWRREPDGGDPRLHYLMAEGPRDGA
ncbi:DUF2913 family protein [Pantoea ananatis]|uniref:DUF2913 family protein n=1 Tax=Pantoea ananas TaxID=553 RepID=UPI00119F86A1|nr:DUF2913 family protein [Pantoea ananatis]